MPACRSSWFTVFVVALLAPVARADEATPIDFARDIAPILETHCLRCHSPNNRKGELSLATGHDLQSLSYISPGDPQSSYLLEQVTPGADGNAAMPKDGPCLSEKERDSLRKWIAAGGAWPESIVLREASKADRSWWSLQPLSRPEPPVTPGAPRDWMQNPIDRWIYAKLAAEKLSPNPPAAKRQLIRRATYDLTGLPPTPEEVQAFVQDSDPQAYPRLIDRLLESPHYGERWGRHWLDVIRFGESRGFERNQIIDNLWPLRDYVIRVFNEDRPFNEVMREHLAGDVIAKNIPEREIGAAFLVSGPYDDVGNQDPVQAAQIRANTLDEIICATSEAFLGLTVGCARCHDHKFDPIRQRDYYALYATFAGVRHGEREVATTAARQTRSDALQPLTDQRDRLARERDELQSAIRNRAEQHKQDHEAKWPRPPVSRTGTEEVFAAVKALAVKLVVEGQEQDPRSRSGYRIDEFEVWTAGENSRNVALSTNGGQAEGASKVAEDFAEAYSARLTIDGKYGARWIAAGPELTIRFAQPELVDRVLFSSDRSGQAGQIREANFVTDYRILASEDGQSWREVANSHDRLPVNNTHRELRLFQAEITPEQQQRLDELNRQITPLERQIAAVPSLPMWWVGQMQQAPGPFHLFLGGSPQKAGEEVQPASLSFLDGIAPAYELDSAGDEGARRLALGDWLVHPQNPITPRVLANRLWHYHFGTGIVETPSDFGYMGGRPTHPELLDWLAGQVHDHHWRLKPLHRLIMLSQSYQQSSDYRESAAARDADARWLWRFPPQRLDAEEIRDSILMIAGQLDRRMGGPGFRLYHYMQDNVATYVPLDNPGRETYRRSVYHQNARATRIDLMTDFDTPDCAFSTPRRAETTTPLQALTMLNHRFTVDMSDAMAERLRSEAGNDADAAIRLGYGLCFSRQPGEEELQECRQLVQAHGLAALCRVLLNTSEFIYVQ